MKKVIIRFLLVMFVVFIGHNAAHSEEVFDESIGYKIFFNSYDGRSNVIEGVEIAGFTQIGGKEFLIVRSAGFSLTNEKGYILFDAVTAIIPDRNIKVNAVNRVKSDGKY